MKRILCLALVLLTACATQPGLKNAGYDPANLDKRTSACTDFYRFANGGWLDTHPIPPSFPAWGQFLVVSGRNREGLHTILEDVNARRASLRDGSDEKKVATLYATCIGEAGRERAGIEPLRSMLSRIDGVTNARDLSRVFGSLSANGAQVPFGSAS